MLSINFEKIPFLLYNGKLIYNLLLPNLSNELNLMIDLHYHLQSLNNPASNSRINEREIWFNILKFLISGKSLEIFLLITYLIPKFIVEFTIIICSWREFNYI